MSDNRTGNGKRDGPVLKWHRWLGLAAALFLILLSITGVVLNHGAALDLDRRTIDSPLILKWYGMGLGGKIVSYRAGNHWVSWSDNHLFLDGRAVVEDTAPLLGIAVSEGIIAAATDADVYLLTSEGDLVERLTGAALPGPLTRVGTDDHGRVIIEATAGTFSAKPDFIGWKETATRAEWSLPDETPAPIRQKVLVDYRGEGLPWSRVLLDVHSGRFFGSWGPLVMDTTAVILIILAITGLINWQRRR